MPVKITVVTPSYNQAQFLGETIRSVLSQREHLHEYFVVDGGSNDGSAEIIREMAPRGIDWWVSEKDAGQPDAIAKGFARATGDILYWINSDDVLLPGVLAKVRAAFEQNPQWDALTGWLIRIDSQSRILAAHRIPRESPRWARWGVVHVTQPTCFFKRSAYERAGGMDLSLHCVLDTELWCRMFEGGGEWGHLPEYLAAFRVHPAAKGSSWHAAYEKEIRELRERFPQYCGRTAKHMAGLGAYRLSQIVSGRHMGAKADTRRLRGKELAEVFG